MKIGRHEIRGQVWTGSWIMLCSFKKTTRASRAESFTCLLPFPVFICRSKDY